MSNKKEVLNNLITKAGNVMARGELSKQQISALADSELQDHEMEAAIAALRVSGSRSDWDIYHQIGDTLRSQTMVTPLSAGFSDRLAARLAAEPPLLAPKPRLSERLSQAWPVAAAAMAAALTGFVIAPQLMRDDAADTSISAKVEEVVSHASVIAKTDVFLSDIARSEVPEGAINDYIRIHHSSHPSLYGATQLARPVDLTKSSEH